MKPKVLISIATDNVGGPGKGLLQFLKWGGEDLVDVTVANYWMGPPGRWPFGDELRKRRIRLEILKQRMTYDPLLLTQAYRMIKRCGIQILQSHGYKSHLVFCILGKLTGLPWIAFVHGWTAENYKIKVYAKLDHAVLRFADRIVVVSGALKGKLNPKWTEGRKTVTIPNAIDPEEYEHPSVEPDIRKQFGVREDEVLIGVVGRFSPEKGHVFFIDAFKMVCDHFPCVRAMFIGDGPDEAIIKDRILKYGLREKIMLPGYQKETGPFYKAFDMVVLPSLSEGMPNVALEAMLFGKPLVATNIGGIPEVVVDELTGKLVPPGDHKRLAIALMNLISRPDLMARYGQKGRERVITEFSPGKRARKIIELYHEILAKHI